MAIKFYYSTSHLKVNNSTRIKAWLEKVILEEGFSPGDISYIFLNDEQIREINSEFLEHDYSTDVISFDYRSEKKVTGEIYIGSDTVRRNAELYNETIRGELYRVLLHGLLHIIGYDDKSTKDKRRMNEKENYYLGKIEE